MEKKALIITMLLLCSTGIKAQSHIGKLRIGFNAGVENNTSSQIMAFDQNTGYNAQYDKLNYRIGVSVEFKLSRNFSFNSALNYSNKDFTGTYYCHVCDPITNPSPEHISFNFVELPLAVRYYFLANKIRFFGEVGLNNLFLLNQERADNTRILGAKLGGGIEYNFTEGLALQISTKRNIGISKLFEKSDFTLNSSAFGIGILKRL